MGIAQLSKQFSKNIEHELTNIFAIMGDSYLPEAAHTYIPTTGQLYKGMDASGASVNSSQLSENSHSDNIETRAAITIRH